MEVWKEFFRLKREEISWWWEDWGYILGVILGCFLLALHFGISLGVLCTGSHWIKYTFYIYPIALTIFITIHAIKWIKEDKSNLVRVIFWLYMLSIIALERYVMLEYVNPYLYIIWKIPQLLCAGIAIVAIPILIVYYVFVVPVKWLHSNWKQAKINVENRK